MLSPTRHTRLRRGRRSIVQRSLPLIGVIVVAAFVLLAVGCGDNDAASPAPVQQNLQAVPFDRAFIDGMVPHHEQAIEMAEDAKAEGLSEPVLIAIADAIIGSQQAEIDRMKQWRSEWFGSATIDPAGAESLGLTMDQMGMHTQRMDFSSVNDVDAVFATMMIAHHEGAIAMANLARTRGERDEIRALALDIIAAQRDELDVMSAFAGGGEHNMDEMSDG